MRLFTALLLAFLTAVLCAAACAEAPESRPAVMEADLGGMEIILCDYRPDAQTQAEKERLTPLMEACRFNLVYRQFGSPDSLVEDLISFFCFPDGSYRVYVLPSELVGTPMSGNMLAAWPSDPAVAEAPGSAMRSFMTRGGRVYGAAVGYPEPDYYLYFNKHSLEQAGVDWRMIDDMQAAGTWNWAAFEDMLQTCRAAGIRCLAGSRNALYRLAVFSNGSSFFDFAPDGRLVVTADCGETREALAWFRRVYAAYFDGDAQERSSCGFFLAPASDADFPPDNWGRAAFPAGPGSQACMSIVSGDVAVIPNAFYTEEELACLAFVCSLLTGPSDGGAHTENCVCMADKALYLGPAEDIECPEWLWTLMDDADLDALLAAIVPVWQGLVDLFSGGAL